MYEQEFNAKVTDLKQKIKNLKKALKVKGITVEEKLQLNRKIEKYEKECQLFNVKKLKLRELPNGMIVNVILLEAFLSKLKGTIDYQLELSDQGLVVEYWYMLYDNAPTGKLTLFDIRHLYGEYDVPNLEGGYQLGSIQTA